MLFHVHFRRWGGALPPQPSHDKRHSSSGEIRRVEMAGELRHLPCMRHAGGRPWREIREVPLLRYVLAVSQSDELTNFRNQVAQAQRSIHTDISRNRYQCSEIRDSESRKNIGFRKLAVSTCFDAEFRKRTSFAFLPQSRSVEIMLMRFTKHRGNGTERELLAFL